MPYPLAVALIGGGAVLLYLLTGGLLSRRLVTPDAAWIRPALLMSGLAAVLLHALLLAPLIYRPSGLDLNFFNVLSLTGWLAAALLLALMPLRPIDNLGIALMPFSALTVLLVLLLPSAQTLVEPAGWPLRAHIVLSILAYAALLLAALQALLLAYAERRLRQRRPGGFVRVLPALTALEALLFQLIGTGFVLLSLALLSGFLFLNDIFAQHLVHKTVLSLLAWLLFGVLLWGRFRHGWRGNTATRWTLTAFATLVLAYFGSQLVLQLLLDRR